MEHVVKSIAVCIINEAYSVRIIECCGYHTLSIPECPATAQSRWIFQAQSSNLGSDWTIFYHCRLKILPCSQRRGKHTTEPFLSITRSWQEDTIRMFGSTEEHHCPYVGNYLHGYLLHKCMAFMNSIDDKNPG